MPRLIGQADDHRLGPMFSLEFHGNKLPSLTISTAANGAGARFCLNNDRANHGALGSWRKQSSFVPSVLQREVDRVSFPRRRLLLNSMAYREDGNRWHLAGFHSTAASCLLLPVCNNVNRVFFHPTGIRDVTWILLVSPIIRQKLGRRKKP